MHYANWQPRGPLAQFVESFWIQEYGPAGTDEVTRVLPVGRPDLVLQYGDAFTKIIDGVKVPCPALAASGQLTQPTYFQATGKTGLFLVQFHPWATDFFGPSIELLDSLVDLKAMVGDAAGNALVDEFQRARGHGERTRIVERFLMQRLPKQTPDQRVVDACRMMQEGCSSVSEVASSLGMTRRHLGRLFRSNAGMTPKAFARVSRFQAATRLKRHGFNWCEIAARCGFSDQAHLNKECMHFSGVTPSVLTELAKRTPLQQHFNSATTYQTELTYYL